jgi:hypothetical protein
MRINITVLLLTLAVAACSDRANRSDANVTDSSGVRIVNGPAADKQLPWTFTERFVFMDSAGEPMLFNGLHESVVAVGKSGEVFVLEHGNSGVAHFDSSGRLVGRLGKKGGGPASIGSNDPFSARAVTEYLSLG